MTPAALRTLALGVALLSVSISSALAQKNFDRPPQMDDAPSTAHDEPNNRFMLKNDSSQTIDNINISPVNSTNWGDDLLGVLALPAHSRIIAAPTQDKGCLFDIRVVYHNHTEEALRHQNLCNLDEISFTGRHARQIRPDSDDNG
jgi:hypothetical protein